MVVRMSGTGVAGIYCRLSVARYGDTTKVEDQERICRALAASRGWAVPPGYVFTDNNRSAWQRDRKRPEWDRMVAEIKAGRLRRLVNYHGDRLIRQPWDLEMLLNFADSLGVVIVSPVGEYQLDVAHDRFVLRILTAKACLESDDISRRKKAGFARMALKGVAPMPAGQGGRGFGYEADGRTPHSVEAEVVKQAARRILAGETLAAICRDLAAAGITSTTGRPLTYGTLKRILLNPRTAGLLRDGSAGSWEPLIDPAAQQMLRSAFITRPGESGKIKYLLSGIATCGICGAKAQSILNGGKLAYGCVPPGCTRIRRNMAHLDGYITARLLALLNSDEARQALPGQSGDGALAMEIAALERQRGQILEVMASLQGKSTDGVMALGSSLLRFDQRIALLRAQTAGPGQQLLAAHAGITAQEFRSLPITMRRSLVAAAYTITIKPASRRGSPGFYPEDVDVRRREP